MPDDLRFLDEVHPIVAAHKATWARDERRFMGGDDVLATELFRWTAEEDSSFELRLATAGYLTLPSEQMSIIAGHLRRASPMPSFGAMGEVRTRDQLSTKSDAELFWYNCDGIGNDGQQLPAFIDGVQMRAGATGFRWCMVETPDFETLQAIRRAAGRSGSSPVPSEQDVQDGHRPYAVESDPETWYNFKVKSGVLCWAVSKIPVEPTDDLNTEKPKDGYYLLVRRGYLGLGTRFAEGGWWKFDGDKVELSHDLWDDPRRRLGTRGQIPLFPFYAEKSKGTRERPALARSLTMELGQIAVDLMNAESEYRYNIRQSCKAINYILGGDATTHAVVVKQQADGSITVTVPPVMFADGKVGIPQIWNSSAGAIDSAVYETLVTRKLSLAREIMVKQLTSTPNSSGASKEAGFTEATAPLLSRLAATREQGENNLLYFTALRFGKEPNAFIVEPREHDLRNVVDDVDAMLDTLRRSALKSPTLTSKVVLAKADAMGFLDDDATNKLIRQELEDSAQQAADQAAQDAALMADVRAGITQPGGTGNGKPAPSGTPAGAPAPAVVPVPA